MSDWRDRARSIRAQEDESGVFEMVAAARDRDAGARVLRQEEFAKKVIHEVLMPVLAEFAGIVTRVSGPPVLHRYDRRTFGVTCDLDSVRFTVHVFLLPDAQVRIAVALAPSRAEPHYRDYPLSARNEEIEPWFGACLVNLYENQVPVHSRQSGMGEQVPAGAG